MDHGRDVRLGSRYIHNGRMGVLMSEILFSILTAAFALLVTMGRLAAMTLLSVKYFEARLKERETETKEKDL